MGYICNVSHATLVPDFQCSFHQPLVADWLLNSRIIEQIWVFATRNCSCRIHFFFGEEKTSILRFRTWRPGRNLLALGKDEYFKQPNLSTCAFNQLCSSMVQLLTSKIFYFKHIVLATRRPHTNVATSSTKACVLLLFGVWSPLVTDHSVRIFQWFDQISS